MLITLGIAGAMGLLLASLYRNNRLLFWCMAGAFFAHLLFVCGLWAVGAILKDRSQERQIAITIAAPVVEKKVEPPPPPPPKTEEDVRRMDLPLGRPDGSRDVTKIRKGSTLDPNAREGAKGAKIFGNQRTMASPTDGGPGDVGYDPDAKGYEIFGPGDSLNVKDLHNIGQPGGGGDDWGVPDGDPDGGVPAGFAQGKRGGRVYFVRLKYGSGNAWFYGNAGTKRLLAFLNRTFPCESDTWPMSTSELKKQYINKGTQPSFIYIYCDAGFKLSSEDVLVLREYLNKGGSLFLDSSADPEIKSVVGREMERILPGARLAPIASSHLIYRFLYILSPPPTGFNFFDNRNYGITHKGRLVAFYCMGDLSQLYANASPDDDPRWTAQYQLGANVMLYGITKGNPAGFVQQQGAKVEITAQMLEKIGFLSSVSEEKPREPGESVKVKPPPSETPAADGQSDEPLPENPDEIKMFD